MSDIEHHEELPVTAILEGLLFVAAEPVSMTQLASLLDIPSAEVEKALRLLEVELNNRGLRIQWHSGRVQMTTAPQISEIIERFLGLEATTKLSRAALETLAIIAYQQPVTRPQVDSIRGVNSDGVLKSLLSKGLLLEIGRAEGPGRPILYGTTSEFLQYFGLTSLGDLPPLNLANEKGFDGVDLLSLKG